jgi:voltage-gated sodium channel
MMIAILLNAIVIYLMYFPSFEHLWYLEVLDQLFIVVFVVEALVKLQYLKGKAYFADPWNRFDFFIVVASLPTLAMHVFPIPDTSLLLLLRLFRLVRLVRFIRFVPHLNKILAGLGRAMKASLFVLLALMLLNFLLSIFTCHFYADRAPDFFGDPLVASYSIFQLFTVEGWNEIPAMITKEGDHPMVIGATRLYFALVVLIGGIFGMSLANAVFVDEMTMDNTDVIEEKINALQEQVAELKALLENHKPDQNA